MEIIKENITTVILVTIIIIILLTVGVFCWKVIKDSEKNSSIEIHEVRESGFIEDNTKDLEDTRLSQIANIFNECEFVKEMRETGITMNAAVQKNEIIVFYTSKVVSFNVIFTVDNDVLSTEIIINEADNRVDRLEFILDLLLVDCVGQTKGYPEGKLFDALGAEEGLNYTLEKEGVERKRLEDGKKILIRVDLNSDFSFLKELE